MKRLTMTKKKTPYNGATAWHVGMGFSREHRHGALFHSFAFVLAGETERLFSFLFLAAFSALKHCQAHCLF
jgi:hypothetical protein